jgi:hypothetical protein
MEPAGGPIDLPKDGNPTQFVVLLHAPLSTIPPQPGCGFSGPKSGRTGSRCIDSRDLNLCRRSLADVLKPSFIGQTEQRPTVRTA